MLKKFFLTVALIAALASPALGQDTQYSPFGTGIIRITDSFNMPVSMAPVPPQLFNVYVNGFFSTPQNIQTFNPTGVATVEFKTASYPALFHYLNVGGTKAEIDILAMPGDTITVNYLAGKFFPEVTGPKTTRDYYRVQEPLHDAQQKLWAIERDTNSTEADIEAARAEFQTTLRELFLANVDNAGSVAVLMKIDRSSWKELLPLIKPEALESPLITPTYWFMRRCILNDIIITPAEVKSL